MEEVKCPNCRKNIAAANFSIHCLYCERNIKLCQLCDEPVARIELDAHLEENHTIKNCPYCQSFYEQWQLKEHKDNCLRRPTSCKFCKEDFIFEEVTEHEIACGCRTEKCLSCDLFVKLVDKDEHLQICSKDKLPLILKTCKYCELTFPLKDYSEHEDMCSSRTEKCNNCNEFVMLKNIDNHQCKKEENYEIPLLCCYCNIEFPHDCLKEHMDTCVETFRIRQQFDNKENASDKDIGQVTAGKLICCQFCGVKFRSKCLEEHEKTCLDRLEKCPVCEEVVMHRDIKKHKNTCQSVCLICSMPVQPSELESHYQLCFNSQLIYTAEQNAESLRDFTSGQTFSKKFQNENKENTYKNNLKQQCPYCGKQLPRKLMDNHIKYCPTVLMKCELCDETYHIEEKHNHLMLCECTKSYESEFKDSSNRFAILENEKVLRELEDNQKECMYCGCKIKISEYEQHAFQCSKSLKQCNFCQITFHKDKEKYHIENCKVVSATGERNMLHDNGYKGVRPKTKKNKPANQESGGLTKFINKVGNFIGWQNDDHCKRNANRGRGHNFQSTEKNSIGNIPTNGTNRSYSSYKGMKQNELIPCEFCGELLPLDFASIALHESGCQPKLVSYPEAINTCNQNKNVTTKYVLDEGDEYNMTNTDALSDDISNTKCNSSSIKKESIENYTFMKNFHGKYNSTNQKEEIDVTKNSCDDSIHRTDNQITSVTNTNYTYLKEKKLCKKREASKEKKLRTNKEISNWVESIQNYGAGQVESGVKDEDFHRHNSLEVCDTSNYIQGRKLITLKNEQQKNIADSPVTKYKTPTQIILTEENAIGTKNKEESKNSFQRAAVYLDTKLLDSSITKEQLNEDLIKNCHEQIECGTYSSEKNSPETINHTSYISNKCLKKIQPLSLQGLNNVAFEKCKQTFRSDNNDNQLQFKEDISSDKKIEVTDSMLFGKKDFSIIYTSEIKGPVKNDRIWKINDEIDIDETEHQLAHKRNSTDGCDGKYYLFPNSSDLQNSNEVSSEINPVEEIKSNEKLYSMDQYNYEKSYVQCEQLRFEENMESVFQNQSEQAMEIDNEFCTPIEALKQNSHVSESNMLNDFSTESNKEIKNHLHKNCLFDEDKFTDLGREDDLDSYFQFLENDNKVCKICGNEICLCKINKNIGYVRSISDESRNAVSDYCVISDDAIDVKDDQNITKTSAFSKCEEKHFDDKSPLLLKKWNTWRVPSDSE